MAALALDVPQGLPLGLGALVGGYLYGALPLAAIVLAVHRRRRRGAVAASAPLRPPRARSATLELLAEGGLRIAATVVILELVKGAVVGLGARLYDDSGWFAATAIAGCVVGDAFPPSPGRRGRRGLVPLVSGTVAALPGAWAAGTFIAIPALVVLLLGGVAYEGAVAVCVPLALILGTHDLRTAPAAAVIVVALVARSRLRRAEHARALSRWRGASGVDAPRVVEVPPPR